MSGSAARRHRGARWVGLVALLTVAACTGSPQAPATVRVDRGPVTTSVSASGSLVAITEQNLGFPDGGKIAEVLVKVGDRVGPGQVLARLDDFELRQTLEQQEAKLAQQQAMLDKIENGNAVEAAEATLEQAEEILDATEEQVDATAASNASATERAAIQLDFDRSALDRAKDRLHDDEEECDADDGSATPTTTATTEADAAGSDGESSESGESTDTTTTTTTTAPASANSSSDACGRIESDKSAVQDAERVVLSSEASLEAAEHKEDVDGASGRVSIENARQSVVTARNDLDSAGTDRPADTESQAAMVRDAEAAVAIARRNLENLALLAPVAGVVSAINGTAGEFVGAASGTTAQAPGSNARKPGVAATTGSGTASGGSAFIVLNNVESFQLVVPFEQSDAARVQPNQRVEVTVDAVEGLTRPGTVLAVAPTGAEDSGIVNYSATIVLTESDPRLRDGQTAEAAVVVDSADAVLRLPSAAVRREGGRSVVSIPGPNGEATTTPFEQGRIGDAYTEVASGLREGQEVLLPQAQVPGAAAQPG